MIFISFWEYFEKRYNIITGNSSTNTTNPGTQITQKKADYADRPLGT